MQYRKLLSVSLFSLLSAAILPAASTWENLGGNLQGKPAVVIEIGGRLAVFARGTDNALWFASQTSPAGSWTQFVSLGGVIISNPTAIADETGKVSVFALGTDSAVWMRSQTTAGIDNYSDWASIGGSGTSDLAIAQTFSQRGSPVNVIRLFVRGTDNALWYSTAGGLSTWSVWNSLGGFLTSAPAAGVLPGGLAIAPFVRGGDNALWHLQSGVWASLGGAMSGPPGVAEINGYVIYRGIDNAFWFVFDNGSGSYSDQTSLGGYFLSNPTMPYSGNVNDLEIFGAGGDNALWVASWNGSTFGPWQSLGGQVVSDPFAIRNYDDTIEVFAIGPDGTLSHIRQSAPGSWQ